jgi:hypothetical protein
MRTIKLTFVAGIVDIATGAQEKADTQHVKAMQTVFRNLYFISMLSWLQNGLLSSTLAKVADYLNKQGFVQGKELFSAFPFVAFYLNALSLNPFPVSFKSSK